jgi:hypothetical protein
MWETALLSYPAPPNLPLVSGAEPRRSGNDYSRVSFFSFLFAARLSWLVVTLSWLLMERKISLVLASYLARCNTRPNCDPCFLGPSPKATYGVHNNTVVLTLEFLVHEFPPEQLSDETELSAVDFAETHEFLSSLSFVTPRGGDECCVLTPKSEKFLHTFEPVVLTVVLTL